MKSFIDTNILLDVLGARAPFYEDAACIWVLAEEGRVEGLVSPVSFTNVFYIVDRWADGESAREAVRLLRDAFTPVACNALIINQAIDADLPDFEDAVQYFSTIHAQADCIVTRNPDDFPRRPEVPIVSPAEFLAEFELQ